MKTKPYLLTLGLLGLTLAQTPLQAAKEAPEERPKIEVCFVLDTTGSMGGLIQGAKDKIWSIANEMVSAKPTPEIRFGLIGYRDITDAYVTKTFDLTEDIDEIYTQLMEFQAQGGGDGPESVNQALHEAVTKMSWNESKDVLKFIFLVGDAPPHMDYQDDVKYPEVCKMAMHKDLIINTIQCGNMSGTAEIWKEIASKAEGEYAAILQSGGTVAISTPYDEDIARLNRELAGTVVGYGDVMAQEKARSKVSAAISSKSEAVADRADYLGKVGGGAPGAPAKVISGNEDLLALVEEDKVDLDELEEEKLPEELKKMSEEERQAHIEKLLDERKQIQVEMSKLVRKRSDFVAEQEKKLAAEGKADGFDLKVKGMLRKQAAAKGVELGTD